MNNEVHNYIIRLVIQSCNAPIKVNSGGGGRPPGHPQDYDRGTSDHTGDIDNSNSFLYITEIILTLQMVKI